MFTTEARRKTKTPLVFLRVLRASVVDSWLSQSRGAANDLRQLGRDLGLAGAVILLTQLPDDVVGVVGRGFHGDAAGDLFADRRVEEALEQADLERHRQDLLKDPRRVRQELVLDRGEPGRVSAGRPRGADATPLAAGHR